MTSPRTSQGGRPPFRRGGRRRRQCFCKESTVDYKDVSSIRRFITDRGRIEAGKKSGNCAKCQRNLTTAIKRARHLALLPYAPDHLRVTGTVATSNKISDEQETAKDEAKEDSKATEAKETAEVTEDAPTAEAGEDTGDEVAEETEEAGEDAADEVAEEAEEAGEDVADEVAEEAEEAKAEETEATTEDVSTDETSEAQDEAPESEEVEADSSDEEDK